jgi:G:T-mismatch repair DNA endonuclease (very short patch repair protein)
MDQYALKHDIQNLVHAHYDKLSGKICGHEHVVTGIDCNKTGKTKVDGFIAKTNTIIEFHGDFFHGNPNVYERDTYNHITKCTMGELYDNTLDRMTQLRDLGYNVLYIWESDYHHWKDHGQFNAMPLQSEW